MRLLHRDHVTGAINLTQDLHSDIPPYSILSHRWGPDEVTLQELSDGTGVSKAGYRKIHFCGEQAWSDGLSYFWVDTCCIDKKNAVELQAAIISMFRWYQDANRCYVYLDDVSCPATQYAGLSEAPSEKRRKHMDTTVSIAPPWHSAFRKSLWFTRGWTLQELLAPTSVEFFSREHTLLGDKSSLERIICDITPIPVEALRNCPLSEFKDKAYAMLGIFYIQMPLLYGEGYAKASGRLRREVSQATKLPPIPVAEGAAFDSRAEEHNARCYPNTRVDLLHQIESWATDPNGKAIFWLNGIAGTGKSTISRTVAQHFHERGLLGASFFFKRGEAERGHAGRLFTTLAAQIAAKLPRVAQHIQTAIDTDPDVCNKALPQQFKELILHALNNVQNPQTLVIVIDALDECDKDLDIRAIIHLLSQVKTIPYVCLRTFLTSRPELPIRLGFQKVQGGYQDLVLHQMPQQIIMDDLRVFFDLELNRIFEEYNTGSFEDAQLPPDWPSQHVDTLVRKACPLFIVAATICRFLDPVRFNPADQLQKLLDYQATAHTSDQLGSTYLPVLNQLISDQSDVNKRYLLGRFRDIVGSIILLAEPLSARALSRILHISLPDIQNQLKLLHSVLDIPSTADDPVRTFHLSFRDFLLDPSRRDTHEFWIDGELSHKKLVSWCIQLLSTNKTLKKDICSLCSPGVSLPEVDHETMNRCLPPEVQYACLYWVHHLELSDEFIQDEDQTHAFLQTHFLHWLEALCLIGKIHDSIGMVQALRELCQPGTRTDTFLQDADRFIRNFTPIIAVHPLQLYCSAISFAPQKSVTRQLFQKEMSTWIVRAPTMADTWNACTQTLEGQNDEIVSIAISLDGRLFASGSRDGVIKIWDLMIGACTQTLEGHSDQVVSIFISPDGRWLASGSPDGVIKIWDMVIGACTQTLEINGELIEPIGISPDGHWLISGFRDENIEIWDVVTGVCIQTLGGCDDGGPICSAAISPDGRWLVSGSFGGIVEIWDMATSSCRSTLFSPTREKVCSIVISSDSHWFASKTDDGIIQIWDLVTGALKMTIRAGIQTRSIVISPNGRWLASIWVPDTWFLETIGHYDNNITIWDVVTGVYTQTLECDDELIRSIATLPNSRWLASVWYHDSWGHHDNNIKIWDVETGVCIQTLKGHNDHISSIAISPNGHWLASASEDKTVKIWDVIIHAYEEPLESRDSLITASPNNCWLALRSSGQNIKIWDVATGAYSQTLQGQSHLIAISSDSCWLASAHHDDNDGDTIRIWDVASGACIQTFKCYDDLIKLIVISPNKCWLASRSSDIKIWDIDGTVGIRDVPAIEIWDVTTGTRKHRFKGHPGGVLSMAFLPDSRRLASASSKAIEIWDVESGICTQSLHGHNQNVWKVSVSPDGRRLASASGDKTIKIWDITTGTCTQTLDIVTLDIGEPRDRNTLTNVEGAATNKFASLLSGIWDTPYFEMDNMEQSEAYVAAIGVPAIFELSYLGYNYRN
ncbi:vegetative incompatibility protein HET-E-1 [Xylaria curta]|nr:vegetative incompatibility protein HET-E-1 [Xylaria curta]